MLGVCKRRVYRNANSAFDRDTRTLRNTPTLTIEDCTSYPGGNRNEGREYRSRVGDLGNRCNIDRWIGVPGSKEKVIKRQSQPYVVFVPYQFSYLKGFIEILWCEFREVPD